MSQRFFLIKSEYRNRQLIKLQNKLHVRIENNMLLMNLTFLLRYCYDIGI